MIVVFHHCGLSIISNMEFLYSWVTNLYICIAQLENTPIKSSHSIFLTILLKGTQVEFKDPNECDTFLKSS